MPSRSLRRVLLLTGVTLALGFAAACSDDADPTSTPTQSRTATATTTPVATATAATSATVRPDAPAAPTGVVITGRIPHLEEPVPPGEAETGRVSITWTASAGAVEGDRIYQEECGREVELALEVSAGETTYGPLNPCRPARVGVAAFVGDIESEISWGVAQE